jgi:hypothetical protein
VLVRLEASIPCEVNGWHTVVDEVGCTPSSGDEHIGVFEQRKLVWLNPDFDLSLSRELVAGLVPGTYAVTEVVVVDVVVVVSLDSELRAGLLCAAS